MGVTVFALALELPIETLVDMHRQELKDDSWFRCRYPIELDPGRERMLTLSPSDMAYYDEFDPEDEKKVKSVWLKGHQDHGAVTMVLCVFPFLRS